MTYAASFLYSAEPAGSVFNMDYYVNVHMPMAVEAFAGTSFRGWEITEYQPGQPFQLITVAHFEDINDFLATNMSELVADIPNFTGTQPTQLIGELAYAYVVPSECESKKRRRSTLA